MSFSTISLHNINITENDVYDALTALDTNKAMGIDSIGPQILKKGAPTLTKPLHYLFTFSINHTFRVAHT